MLNSRYKKEKASIWAVSEGLPLGSPLVLQLAFTGTAGQTLCLRRKNAAHCEWLRDDFIFNDHHGSTAQISEKLVKKCSIALSC